MRLIYKVAKQVLICTVIFQASASTLPISVTVQPTAGPVKAGSELQVKVTTTNTSDHEIRFARGFGEQEFDFDIEARDEKGQAPPPTETYRQMKDHPSSRREATLHMC
jgi:hypothetical protein